MKRLFLLFACISLLCGCEINISFGDTEEETQTPDIEIENPPTEEVVFQRDSLYGEWKVIKAKFAQDATMTAWEYEETYATFKENGIYEGEGYWGNGVGTYSITGNTITSYVDNVPYIKYEVLSLTGKEAEIKATIVSTSQNVWLLCEKVEYIDQKPSNDVVDDSMYMDKNNAWVAINGVYAYAREFVLYQHYIEYNALRNNRSELSPRSNLISAAWAKGYKVISASNQFIKILSTLGTNSWTDTYISQLKAVRAFVYYNMLTLWGDIPYWLEDYDINANPYLSRTDSSEILNSEIGALNTFVLNPKEMQAVNSMFTDDSVKMLMAEMYLYLGDMEKAKQMLSGVNKIDYTNRAAFTFPLADYNTNGDTYFIRYKDLIWPAAATSVDVYTTNNLVLYIREAEADTADLPSMWQAEDMSQYGHWAMLNRLGKTVETVSCAPHETLMPIPMSEISINPNIIQNPGY